MSDPIRFPRTIHGWRKLFWITVGVCPIHWAWLRATWQDRPNAFCFSCEGIGIYPDGFMAALRMNAYAEQLKAEDAAVPRPTADEKGDSK